MSPRYSQSIDQTDQLADACRLFLADLGAWIQDCMARYADAPATDVHDQGTFTTGWAPYVAAVDDGSALAFMKELRDRMRAHYVETDQGHHGYWRMQEAHHGTEHFELFLGTLLRLDPNDEETQRQLLDAAEHMGNWSSEVPPWFDWDTGRFRSLYFGADGVREEPGMSINTPDHLRCVNNCLLAHDAGGAEQYHDFAVLYAGEWADAILAEERIPLALTPDGVLYELDEEEEAVYRSFVGQVSALQSPVDRAENLLTSDAINTFLRLWNDTDDERFRLATEKLMDILVTQLIDPDAGVVADAVRTYRRWTGDDRYDGGVQAIVAQGAPRTVRELALDTDFQLDGRPSGVGKRSDAPRWLEDGLPRWHNPITIAVAAEIQDDERLATRAVDLARTYFSLAREAFPDGREHGCAARTVSALARGHGRENHAGMTTAVLGPILESFKIPLQDE